MEETPEPWTAGTTSMASEKPPLRGADTAPAAETDDGHRDTAVPGTDLGHSLLCGQGPSGQGRFSAPLGAAGYGEPPQLTHSPWHLSGWASALGHQLPKPRCPHTLPPAMTPGSSALLPRGLRSPVARTPSPAVMPSSAALLPRALRSPVAPGALRGTRPSCRHVSSESAPQPQPVGLCTQSPRVKNWGSGDPRGAWPEGQRG